MDYLDQELLDKNIKDIIFNKSFDKDFFTNANITIKKQILNIQQNIKKDNKWHSCVNVCYHILYELIEKEINSTAYILKCLYNSIISVEDKNLNITITEINKITGNWSEDNQYIKINLQNTQNRLLFGFGPSASGKSYIAKTFISLLSENIHNFPKTFLCIDGGIYRDSSFIYKSIIQEIQNLHDDRFHGLTNLMSGSGIEVKSLFSSGKIKKTIINYLLRFKNRLSLYVPETLSSCNNVDEKCISVYKPFIEITGDKNWISLLVYQHKSGKDCDMDDGFKCVGTTESGQKRQIEDGKIYSNKSYEKSMKNGMDELINSVGGSFLIHNSGGLSNSKTLVTEYSKSLLLNYNLFIEKNINGLNGYVSDKYPNFFFIKNIKQNGGYKQKYLKYKHKYIKLKRHSY
jgi:energy-coupling factor transporter ATP-binding protein EcfA2